MQDAIDMHEVRLSRDRCPVHRVSTSAPERWRRTAGVRQELVSNAVSLERGLDMKSLADGDAGSTRALDRFAPIRQREESREQRLRRREVRIPDVIDDNDSHSSMKLMRVLSSCRLKRERVAVAAAVHLDRV